MRLALLAGLLIVAVAAAPSAARAVPRFGAAAATSAAPSFLVQIGHHHHRRHHWRHGLVPDEAGGDNAPEGSSAAPAPQPATTPKGGSKPRIEWVDPERSRR